jgi:hypothetical protein
MAAMMIAALALAACATSETAGGGASQGATNDCFRTADVHGYNVIDRTHVGVRVGANRQYILTTLWNTSDLDWTEAIAIRTATGRVCTGNGLGVEIIGGRPPRTYPIASVERAPEEPAAPEGS